MRVAIITTDNREPFRQYDRATPWFGTAPEALLQGLRGSEAEVHVLSCTQSPMISSPEKLAQNIWFHSLHVPKAGWMRTLYRGCISAVRRRIRHIGADIVHGQGTERECAVSAVFSGLPNVVTIHGNMAELSRLFGRENKVFYWLAARLEDFALRRTAGVLCNSAYTERLVKPRARHVWRVPNALREPFFAPIRPVHEQAPILLNIGVLSARKRQVELLDIAARLQHQGLKFEIRFIGDAPKNSYVSTFFEKLKPLEEAGFARYLGPKSTAELIDAFDGAAGVIHFPSEEAFGLVVGEALARNRKFFGSRVGGIIDIASGVPGAELFESSDWSGLAEAISAWIVAGCPQASGAGEIMRLRYHPVVIAAKHMEIYREVLGQAGSKERRA